MNNVMVVDTCLPEVNEKIKNVSSNIKELLEEICNVNCTCEPEDIQLRFDELLNGLNQEELKLVFDEILNSSNSSKLKEVYNAIISLYTSANVEVKKDETILTLKKERKGKKNVKSK